MTRARTCLCVLTACLLLVGGWPQAAAPPAAAEGSSLTSFLDLSSGLVRDTNGDGIADAVVGRIVVPAAPTIEDAQAAANLAARLGFETSALTLPIVLRDTDTIPTGTPSILVGRGNALTQRLAASGALDLKSLKPGQGVIAAVAPSGQRTIVVAGGDDEGTLAAANELAARLPRLWNMTGITLAGIEDQVGAFLRARGIDGGRPAVDSVVVDSNRRGLAAVHVRLAATAPQARVAKAIEDLDAAHRRGLEPSTLNYAEAASVVLHVGSSEMTVRRAGLNQRTLTPPIEPDELATDSPGERGAPATAPRAPAKNFDLSNAFSIEGWFGDSYTDLIPDRTETSLIVGGADDALGAAHIAGRLGLETTGVTLPISKRDNDVRDAAREASPILVGRANALTAQLTKIGRARLDDLQAGEGAIQIVPRAFGSATATVVAGADSAGTESRHDEGVPRGRRAEGSVPHAWGDGRGGAVGASRRRPHPRLR